MLLRDTQATFGGGEFTPALWGRTDIQKYKTGTKAARNVNILPQGGARNRAGTAYVAKAADSTNPVRVIPFIASSTQTYMIELGNFYARFYTADAQIQTNPPSAWLTGTGYVVGNFVAQGGQTYYCLISHTSGTFATDLAAGKWRLQTAYQIVTPWAGADLFKIRFAQSADVLYLAHPSYAPQQLTFNSAANWVLAAYSFINGPFMVENTDTTSTITPSALTGSVTLTATKSIFNAGQVGAFFELLATVVGQTITPALTAAAVNWIPTGTTWQCATSGTWSGTILVQTSPDNITWTTVSTVTSNGTVSGATGFAQGYMRAIMQSALPFSGSATATMTGNGTATAATNIAAINQATAVASDGDTAKITITGTWTGTIQLQRSDDGGATWTSLASYTTNQAGTTVATTKAFCLIRAQATAAMTGLAVVTVDGTTGAAPTLAVTISSASVSSSIQCGSTWSAITAGNWTGKLRVEISTDGGNNWQLIQTFQSGGTNNFNTSGSTGVSQCLLRVSTDQAVAFSGTATVDLTSNSFNWTGIVKITAFSSATSVTATVQNLSNTNSTGLANTSATWQWSEGSWSTYRGFPTCVTFYQDRAVWASTPNSEPNTVWHSKTSSYADFGISSPLVDSDGFSVVLSSRQLNSVNALVPMPQAMICLSGDTAFGLAPGSSGVYSALSIQQTPMDHRGSYNVDPVVVGNEIVLIQQMGTVVRNLIFQLAVNGFMGDNISVSSQHLFTGYNIVQMAYQQEPDSIVWAVRNDGQLLSCTYDRGQEMNAWTHHDTLGGLFESVACIPNSTLGINEIWFVVNRSGTRFIEVLKPRDQGTVLSSQWFVDCGTQYSGAQATVISNIPLADGTVVAVLADGNVVANGVNDTNPIKVLGGSITIPNAASVVTVGIPMVWDVGLLDIETPNQKGSLQGQRVKMPRAKIRCWNSRGGYISTTPPASNTGLTDTNGGSFDALPDIMQRDPSTPMDTPMPLVTGIVDTPLPSGYQYGVGICLRGIDPLPFTLLDVLAVVVPGGD